MRLAVLIPAYNEKKSIADILRRLPKSLPTITTIEAIVIDDGSTDGTLEIAKAEGAIVLSHPRRLGLASAFRSAVGEALKRGADLLVTLDADGQYRPEEIELLLSTMQKQDADLVIGNRKIFSCSHMPIGNRVGNIVGSMMLRIMGATRVADASSGFRLFTKALAESLRITSSHTYTHEMLIQADAYGFTVSEVDITFLPRPHGRSKLVRTLRHHILRSCGTIVRSTFLYKPLRKFLLLSALCMLVAAVTLLFAFKNFTFEFGPMIFAILFAVAGLQFLILGIIAEAYAAERRLQHERTFSRDA